MSSDEREEDEEDDEEEDEDWESGDESEDEDDEDADDEDEPVQRGRSKRKLGASIATQSDKTVKLGRRQRKLNIGPDFFRPDGRLKSWARLKSEGHRVTSPPSQKPGYRARQERERYQKRRAAGEPPRQGCRALRCKHERLLRRCRDCWEDPVARGFAIQQFGAGYFDFCECGPGHKGTRRIYRCTNPSCEFKRARFERTGNPRWKTEDPKKNKKDDK